MGFFRNIFKDSRGDFLVTPGSSHVILLGKPLRILNIRYYKSQMEIQINTYKIFLLYKYRILFVSLLLLVIYFDEIVMIL